MVQYRFFGGKGGVGKTTCAAAFAVASARAGRRTLLVSTDPAPSAGDALRQPLTGAPRPVKGTRARLHALEVDASRAIDRWLTPRRDTLEAIALRGTWLDQEDVASLLRLSLPGIDEVAALIEIARLSGTGRYDLLVVDTAPTGHTLRMLAMPALLRTIAVVFDGMQSKHRAMVEALRGRWSPDDTDALIDALDDEGRELSALLTDRSRTAMTWVTLPEPMSIAESADALAELRRLGICVDTIVVNRVTPVPDRACRWCSARRAFERQTLDAVAQQARDSSARIAIVDAQPSEPRGLRALSALNAEMTRPPRPARPDRKPRAPASVTAIARAPRGQPITLPPDPRVSLLMFGGKGGVGKTTCAAATALAVAAEHPRRPVLLLSSDPAHSLADVLGVPLSDQPRRIAGAPANLTVRELDAAARFESIKARYTSAIDGLFERLVRGTAVNAGADRQAMRDLIELAPPGLDELVAIVEVSDALEPGGAGALVVLDTAPTGHALRLLEMPAVVHEWVKALMSIVLKYQPVVGIGELGAVLLQMSQGLGRLRALLMDPARAAFVAVTRPAALPVAETVRLLKRLEPLAIDVPAVIVNAAGAGTCGRCVRTHREQQRAMVAIRRAAGSRGRQAPVVIAPAVMPPPHGPIALPKWRASWIADRG